MTKLLPVLCFVWLGIAPVAQGLSYSTAEGSTVNQIAMFIEIYCAANSGRTPQSWADLEVHVGRPVDELWDHILPSQRYAFVVGDVELPEPHAGKLILLTRQSFRDSMLSTNWWGGLSSGFREPGRYVIYMTKSGEIDRRYVSEEFVAKAFAGSEELLPEPDSLPERAHLKKLRNEIIIKRMLVGGMLLVLVRILVWPLVKRCVGALKPA